ncbi:hypothetical protein LTR47_006062 [Exophiala xenobiotica]|nr:hypothetical protein LTR72_009603 [Exophiala xenobiotica]KAK5232835.1 hypothetical protein LTR47_006062 [Exophiala xenobiotica]KAK5255427.1 hypothetical protein LTS06_000448 [Exophiala xenobiotica]KAK5287927.1 hypothetical protein LTR14_008710 [Exophiala xenobiotica]KAK5316741.1 hypothetical protein LTR93_009053 [Exophiala xenobiotica]
MDTQGFLDHVNDLSDLELAVLLSLVAQHHCLIKTPEEFLDDVASELALIVTDIFNLSYIIINQGSLQSVDSFVSAILDDASELGDTPEQSDNDIENGGALRSRIAGVDFRGPTSTHAVQSNLDSRKVVNVVIAKDFDRAHEDVQIQALENDRIFMSHQHSPEDGFSNLEELDEANNADDNHSMYSYSTSPSIRRQKAVASRRINPKLIIELRTQGQAATITPEIRRYLQDVVAFLRMERGIDGGVTPYATTLFLALAKYLAPFHGLDYVTPSLIGLAARKIYPHRLVIATPSRERSTLYGTDLATARDLLEDLDPEKAIQNVLDTVECPT